MNLDLMVGKASAVGSSFMRVQLHAARYRSGRWLGCAGSTWHGREDGRR